jgi:threonine/homoserine/homoserine lactone efflux protein
MCGRVLTFLGLSVLLILTPGPNQALLTARVLSGGRGSGFAAVRGLACGMAVHVVAAIVGLSALLASSAEVFGAVKLLGGVYLLYLGVAAILRARRPVALGEAEIRSGGSPFRDGLLSMTLNPKAAVFFVAVVPQFVSPGPGAATRVAALLLVYGALCLVFWSGFVLLLHRARAVVARPGVRAWAERLTGGALIGLGARLAGAP